MNARHADASGCRLGRTRTTWCPTNRSRHGRASLVMKAQSQTSSAVLKPTLGHGPYPFAGGGFDMCKLRNSLVHFRADFRAIFPRTKNAPPPVFWRPDENTGGNANTNTMQTVCAKTAKKNTRSQRSQSCRCVSSVDCSVTSSPEIRSANVVASATRSATRQTAVWSAREMSSGSSASFTAPRTPRRMYGICASATPTFFSCPARGSRSDWP